MSAARRHPDIIFGVLAGYFALLYVLPAIQQYLGYQLTTFDYGIQYQSTLLLWQRLSSHVGSLMVTLRGVHLWAENQDYIQLVLAVLHIFPGAHYLIIALHAFAAWSVPVLCYFCCRPMGYSAVALAAALWLSPFLINIALDLFHPEIFATIFVVGMVISANAGRTRWFLFTAASALLCKEDVAITVVSLSLLMILRIIPVRVPRASVVCCFLLAMLLFSINLGVVLPHFKLESCRWLGWLNNDAVSVVVNSSPSSPWFSHLFNNPLSGELWRGLLLRREVLTYLLLLFWPVFIFGPYSLRVAAAAIPGALINILTGYPYHVSGFYHYDHTTFGVVVAGVLVGLGRCSWPRLRVASLLAVALALQLIWSGGFRVAVGSPLSRDFWQLEKSDEVALLEVLSRALPSGAVISADYTSASYLLSPSRQLFMFPNPFTREYFGLYGQCEGFAADAPLVDLVVIHHSKDVPVAVTKILREQYSTFYLAKPGLWLHVYNRSRYESELKYIVNIFSAAHG